MQEHLTASPASAVDLLTIIVPTYNRAPLVGRLLRMLRDEVRDLEGVVTVLVSDNASTDDTADVIQAIHTDWPALVVQRHSENVGADSNFCGCVERTTSRYFWIIGDDDMPRRGAIQALVSLLRQSTPALVYVQSEWLNDIAAEAQKPCSAELTAETMDSLEFARRVHVWFTFLSGVIVDRTLLLDTVGAEAIRRYTGSSLVQLGWILPLLNADARHVFVSDCCVLATKENSGGYPLLTVFGVRFARIVNELFGRHSRIANALLRGNMLHYLPGLIWSGRIGTHKRHLVEDAWPEMRAELGGSALFWTLLVPLGRFPYPFAQLVHQSWRVFHRLSREAARLRTRSVRRNPQAA